MRKRRKSTCVISLPPRLPQNAGELKRAIMLLGERKKTELHERARNDLLQLLGVYPTVKEVLSDPLLMRSLDLRGPLVFEIAARLRALGFLPDLGALTRS